MHAITIRNGEASFVYNGDNGDPWHTLGTSMSGYGTRDEMLAACHANWQVEFEPVFRRNEDGDYVEVEGYRCSVRPLIELTDDGVTKTTNFLGIVSDTWQAEHNQDATDFALAICDATGNDAVIDTMGQLFDDKQFFVCIQLDTLVLDPDGVADAIKRYLVVRNAHNASMSLTAFTTNTRVVCQNTANFAEQAATDVIRIRHSASKDERKAQAIDTLGIAEANQRAFVAKCEAMMAAEGGNDVLDTVIKGLWDKDEADTDRKLANWKTRRTALHRLYDADTNAGGFGDTGWAVYNTIGEYLDHGRERANPLATANPQGEVATMKRRAAELVLA